MKKDRDWLDMVDIGGKVATSVAAVAIAALAYSLQQSNVERNALDRTSATVAEIERNHADDGKSPASAGLVQIVLHGTAEQRRAASLALAQVDPRLLIDLLPGLVATTRSESDTIFLHSIMNEASEIDVINTFLRSIRMARDFLKRDLHQRACVEYLRAWNGLPARFESLVDRAQFDEGSRLCRSREQARGAPKLQQAFSRVLVVE